MRRRRSNRPGIFTIYMILRYLVRHQTQVDRGKSWPTQFNMRTNLFRSEPIDVEEPIPPGHEDHRINRGSSPRSDLFADQIEVCKMLGWVEEIEDVGVRRYKITEEGKKNDEEIGLKFVKGFEKVFVAEEKVKEHRDARIRRKRVRR